MGRNPLTAGGSDERSATISAASGISSIGDFVFCHIVNFCASRCVYVLILFEGVTHIGIATDRSHNAQLDLRVIGAQQQVVIVSRYKCFSYFPTPVTSDGNILQVRVVTGQSSGYRHGLAVGCVDASSPSIYQLR